MPTAGRRTSRLRTAVAAPDLGVLLVLVLGTGAVAVLQGQDSSWDFRAYHLHNGWAFWNDRLSVDIAPAGAHNYFNPLLDAVAYALLQPSPLIGTAALGAWVGVGAFLLHLTALRLLPLFPYRRVVSAGMVGFATIGGLTASMTGNLMGETQLMPLLFGAVLLGVVAHEAETTGPPGGRRAAICWFSCAALLGAATGLKFTAASYAVGPLLVLGLWLLARSRWRSTVWAVVGSLTGFFLTYGWWGWTLHRTFESPVFPLYNSLIRSPYTAPVDIDILLTTASFSTALLAPAGWAFGDPALSEAPFQDARTLLGLLACLAAVVLGARARLAFPPALVGLSWCYLAAFLVWAVEFRIARYTAGLEVLGGMMFCTVALVLVHRLASRRAQALGSALVLGVVLVALASTDIARFGRSPFAETVSAQLSPLALPRGALILLLDRPNNSNQLTQLLPDLGDDKVYAQPAGQLIRPGDGTVLSRRVAAAVDRVEDIYALSYRDRDTDFSSGALRQLGLCPTGPAQEALTRYSGEVIIARRVAPCQPIGPATSS